MKKSKTIPAAPLRSRWGTTPLRVGFEPLHARQQADDDIPRGFIRVEGQGFLLNPREIVQFIDHAERCEWQRAGWKSQSTSCGDLDRALSGNDRDIRIPSALSSFACETDMDNLDPAEATNLH